METDCRVSSPENCNIEVPPNDQLDATFTLSNLLSSVLGSIDDFDSSLDTGESAPKGHTQNEGGDKPLFDNSMPNTEDSSKWNSNSAGDQPYWDLAVPNQTSQWDTSVNEITNERPAWETPAKVESVLPVPWDVSKVNNTSWDKLGTSSSWQPATANESLDPIPNLPPFTDVLRPSTLEYGCHNHQGNVIASDEAVVPWVPQTEFQGAPGSYGLCGPSEDHVGGYYFNASPHIKSKRMEHTVSIKIENPESHPASHPAKASILTPLPMDIQRYSNPGIHFPDSGIVQNYAPSARIWGLTVEQWQTQQTTYRYFPSHCETPYWQGWPFEMPSSGESSPTPDPMGSQGTSETSPNPGGGASSKGSNSKRVEGKRCGVCGDRALGYNFNAITCESCKAFFRRNALKNKEYRCPFNDECEVTAVTRRFCQRCRLRKCFEVGMKKEWIMSEEEKRKKRKKIEENRARKIGEMEPSGKNINNGCLDDPFGQRSNSNSDGDDDSRSYCSSSIELSLPLKSPSVITAKPKAVVVGRVRVEENEAKVRRTSLQSDVHTQKVVTPSNVSIPLKTSVPPSAQLGNESSASYATSPPVHGANATGTPPQQQQPPLPNHHPQPQHPITSDASVESLVVGLLRTQSHGSAEDEPPVPPSQAWGCQGGEKYLEVSGVIIKREVEENTSEELDHLSSYEFSSSSSIPSQQQQQQQQQLPYPNSSPLYQGTPPQTVISSPLNPETSKFEFSIQEALSMIQPGCRERGSCVPSSGNNVMESIMNTAISAEYSAFSLLINSHSSELNQAETIKITELLEASKGLNTPLCEEPSYKDLPNPSLINVINLTEIAIRRLIKMAKKISAFKTFCQEDQIALLKGGCTEMMILRSVFAYDPDKDVWKIQQDHERFKNIKLKVLKAAPGNVYEEHKRFMLSFHPDWRQDMRIIALLAAIALFTPERANVIHPKAVRHEQSSYLYLLKRYLECKYGGCVGKTNYLKLLEIIGNLHILNEDHVKVFLEVNPQEVGPLLIEIFDLKQS